MKGLKSRFITYKNSRICWYLFGTGTRFVICFHGYGENGNQFSFLDNQATRQFSFIAIDLPFHGKTEWNEDLNFKWEDLRDMIEMILGEVNDKSKIINEKFILLGFSLGGRIALSLYQAIPVKIERVVLLAPDGLKINFWYWLSTQTWLGNKIFYFTMQNPNWFFGFLKMVNRLGIVNASVFKFVKYYIDNKALRHELYNRWTALRRLRPNRSTIKSLIVQNKTSLRLVYGKHDRIILTRVGERFRKGIEEYCNVSVIESGHQVLHVKHMTDIVNQLTS